MLTDDAFLQALGGVGPNSLNNKLNLENSENSENDQIQIIRHSSYFDADKLNMTIRSKRNCFSILSTNIQYVNAKFDEFEIFINDLKEQQFEFSAICIQESWLTDRSSTKQLELDHYNLIPQGRSCSKKGGLMIYLNKKFDYHVIMTLNTYDTWEGQIVRITKGGLLKPIILANIYRPPKNFNQKYRQFTQELTPILKSLENMNTECIITGDFNIDLLQINEREVFSEFFN